MSLEKNNSAVTAVAMSGGVDSSTVAAILREAGQPIVGLTMQLWNQPLRVAACSRRRQGPVLFPLRPDSGADGSHRLPARRVDQGGGARHCPARRTPGRRKA